MQSPKRTGELFGIGIPLLLSALFSQTVTLASGHYAGVLFIALILIVLADVCFVQAFRRGGAIAKIVSVVLLLPTLFVITDFIRRAPHVFGY